MEEKYKEFMLNSNRIEGEDRINPNDILAVRTILKSDLNEDIVLTVHKLLGEYLNKDWTGKYRKGEVRVGNYFPPRAKNVPYLMKEYFEKLPIMDAWTAHNNFESIHCFQDLNGRVGRLIWLKKAIEEGYKFELSFLHIYYYQTLAHR